MKKDDLVYLHHILDAIDLIQEYLHGVSEERFYQERLIQDGVMRELEIIGEASRSISSEFREKHKEIHWTEIAGMRNRIVHEYFDVDLEIVWEVAKTDLVDLKSNVTRYIQQMS